MISKKKVGGFYASKVTAHGELLEKSVRKESLLTLEILIHTEDVGILDSSFGHIQNGEDKQAEAKYPENSSSDVGGVM